MNENFELEILGRLYEQMFTTRAKTDGRLMELESFIVRHYGHAGTTLIRTIGERHSVGPVVVSEQPKQGRQLRPFVHPDTKQKQPTKLTTTKKTDVVAADQPVAPVEPAEQPVIQSTVASGEGNPPLTSNEPPVVAVDGGDDTTATTNVAPITISPDAETNVTMTTEGFNEFAAAAELTVDVADAKTMKAAAFGKKYGERALRKFLTDRGVVIPGNPSVTQIASLTIQTITGK